MGHFNVLQIILDANLVVQMVMLLLLLASGLVWFLGFAKFKEIIAVQRQSEAFETQFWNSENLTELFEQKSSSAEGGTNALFLAGFSTFSELNTSAQKAPISVVMDQIVRRMQVSKNDMMRSLESHLNVLATIGSSAPYIGLFGTVWGIMHAFSALGQVKHATLTLVAPGISEALVATAMGLFVAIPAVIFYNRLVNRVDDLEQGFSTYIDAFSALVEKQLYLDRNAS